jgi:hypothetical protein
VARALSEGATGALRVLVGTLLGVLGACLLGRLGVVADLVHARSKAARARTPAWVVADRDGDELVELDDDLLVLSRRRLESPLFLRAGRPGWLWIVHAPLGRPAGPCELAASEFGGEPRRVVGLDEVLDLAVDGDGRALALVRAAQGSVHLERVDPSGEHCRLPVPAGAQRVVWNGGRVAVALGSAGWALFDEPLGTWRPLPGLDGAAVCDLAPGPAGGWRTLVLASGESNARLVELDFELVPREVLAAGSCRRLARGHVRAGRAWVWSADGRAALRLPVNWEAELRGLPALGARAALEERDGGLLVATAGAILRLDPAGRALPGQGGFVRLVDVERAGRAPTGP